MPDGLKGGDLLGVVQRLDHLNKLGIAAIYLNPISQSVPNPKELT